MSYEHEISIVSAITLKEKLPSIAHFIFCDAHREFYLIPAEQMKSKTFSSGAYRKMAKLTLRHGGFFQKALMKEKRLACDVVINLIHGSDGEDGKMAALFSFFDLPFIGPRIEASVLSFNKEYTKLYASALGVQTLPYEIVRRGEERIRMPLPVILKPLRLGSSIGVSIVKEPSQLQYALDVAFEFDEEVLVEPFKEGVREYNLAGIRAEEFHFSIVEEPQKEQFLDFEKKYLDFGRSSRVQRADIDEALELRLHEQFKKIYGRLFEGALIRCDFFVIDDEIYLNEINPIPGSYANYLFDDFPAIMEQLAHHLPRARHIPIDYTYIHSIQQAKGK